MGGRIILARAPLAIRAVGEAVIEALSLVVTQESTQIKGLALLVKAFTLACPADVLVPRAASLWRPQAIGFGLEISAIRFVFLGNWAEEHRLWRNQ